jgi:hypothetical protein
MVMTILEAHVAQKDWAALERAFQEGARHQDAGLVQSFLVHSTNYVELWRIITIWSSREALDAMRRSGEVPRGVQMFHSAHAEPVLTIFEVAQHIAP